MQKSAKLRKKIEIPHPGRTLKRRVAAEATSEEAMEHLAGLESLSIATKFDSCTGKVTDGFEGKPAKGPVRSQIARSVGKTEDPQSDNPQMLRPIIGPAFGCFQGAAPRVTTHR